MATQHRPAEWSFQSGKQYGDAFNEIEFDVVFQQDNGKQLSGSGVLGRRSGLASPLRCAGSRTILLAIRLHRHFQ